jgi:hypothetical protein
MHARYNNGKDQDIQMFMDSSVTGLEYVLRLEPVNTYDSPSIHRFRY